MIKNNLLEREYHFEEKTAKESIIGIIWAFFVVFFTSIIAALFLFNYDSLNVNVIGEHLTAVMIVALLAAYLVLKFLVTSLFCHDKSSTKFKLLEAKCIPVCSCREAFRVWQIILIYLIPFIVAHAGLIITGLLMGGSPTFIILLFLLEFFMALDLTLVIYVIYVKIRYKPDYISVNHHVYNLTLYSKIYIRRNKRNRRRI